MKYQIALFFLITFSTLLGQDITGVWKTVDDSNGKAESHVRIFKKGNAYYGKIIKLLVKPENDLCVKCKDDRKNKPLLGLEVIRNMVKNDDGEYTGGRLLEPKMGIIVKGYLKLLEKDKLKVRGFLGSRFLGRTQIWHRVK